MESISVSTFAALDPRERHFLATSLQAYLDEMVRDLHDPEVRDMIDETWREKARSAA